MIDSGFPWWFRGKESTCQCRRFRFDPWVRKIPWKWQPILIFLPGKSHGQRFPVGCSPGGCKRVEHDLGLNSNSNNMIDSTTTETEWSKVLQRQLFHLYNINTHKVTSCPPIFSTWSVKTIEFWKAEHHIEMTCDWMEGLEKDLWKETTQLTPKQQGIQGKDPWAVENSHVTLQLALQVL